MTSSSFTTQTHGKWILAGEHAVLRGKPALVFPIKARPFQLHYQLSDAPCKVNFQGVHGEQAQLCFWGVLEHGLELVGRSISDCQGTFTIHNQVPAGAGMGLSAAACAALSRWFVWQAYVKADQQFEFARQLEDLFHGQSSGVDIAGADADQGVYFKCDGTRETIIPSWQPKLTLSSCNQVGLTAKCVQQVQDLWERDPQLAATIDDDMQAAVELAREGLLDDPERGLTNLASAINQARVCFSRWGLCDGKVDQHINECFQAGALAAKPTGSGDGGFILSLWQNDAKPVISSPLIHLD